MTREGQHSFWGQLVRNPLIVATVCGLVANCWAYSMPTWLEPPVARIGAASIALGLMLGRRGMPAGPADPAKRWSVGACWAFATPSSPWSRWGPFTCLVCKVTKP